MASILGGFATLALRNAWRFDWIRGYDADANDRYAATVAAGNGLPSAEESGVWHTPPLWFALAGGLRRFADDAQWSPVQRPGQLLAALAGIALCVIVLLLARELWPKRRAVHLVALCLVAASPALVRASAMYHPETLAAALGTGGLLVGSRSLRRGPTLAGGVAAGLLLGLASLTRAWALPVLVVVLGALVLDAVRRHAWGPTLALAVTASVLVAPWLVNQQIRHGSALAFNREAPGQRLFDRRPASFFLGPRTLRVFDRPVTPVARNELVPQLYADWWGDWGLTWDTPPPPPPAALLPAHVREMRVRQSFVGLLPTLAAIAGLAALSLLAVARRSLAIAVVPAASLAVVASFVVFTVLYPSGDGDTIKATYLLLALPGAALGAGVTVDALRPRGRLGALATGVALGLLVLVQLPFLVL